MGAVAHFTDKFGVRRTITIHKVNPKTVSGVETTATGSVKWRVSPHFLSVDEAVAAPTVSLAPKHVPTTASSATW